MKEVTLNFFHISEKLPEKSDNYLTISKYKDGILGNLFILPYSVKHKKFNADDYDDKPKYAIDEIVYWAEIPDLKNY